MLAAAIHLITILLTRMMWPVVKLRTNMNISTNIMTAVTKAGWKGLEVAVQVRVLVITTIIIQDTIIAIVVMVVQIFPSDLVWDMDMAWGMV